MKWEVEQNLFKGKSFQLTKWFFFLNFVTGYLDSDGNELWVYNYNNYLPI